ncbi:hypothetical protein PR202_gb28502 [Eleusine coracana subsp. coracana]|uniref:GDSL esterase/lipase n=1 Tax=Eleusine coracana subsp. coracana TaxID=191504 RepID=A0AAV5FUJ1_ELECO|nr:hypothetical protein PR202_gb28502 [Eleusine coracana subsp. coracana]
MYVFGDSLMDVGNNNYLPGNGVSRANRPYYGKDYPSRIPTGRFSNGYNTADFTAKSMGFVDGSPPAYLSLLSHHHHHHNHQQDSRRSRLVATTALSRGVSYASGGAGILNSTNAGKTIPLWKQVHYFNATRTRMIATQGSSGAVNDLLARSVFLMCIGSNDIFAFAIATQNNQQMMMRNAAAFYNSLISIYSDTIEELYRMGARRFAIMNVGLVGCVPVARLLSPAGNCSNGLNQLAAGFNNELSSLMHSLAKTRHLPELFYSLADSHGVAEDTFADPVVSGYTDVASACCGGGRLNAEASCTPKSVLCTNRDQHVFFDQFHPSQRAAFLTVKAFYHDPNHHYTTPINFMQLHMCSY